MFLRLLSTSALCLGLSSLPALAFDPAAMSETERKAFGEAVRQYLIDQPEVLMEAFTVLEERQLAARAKMEEDILTNNRDLLQNNPDDWAGGNLNGDITLVEFVDYRCGYCRKAWSEVEALVKADPNLRIVYKEFPFLTPESTVFAQFAIAVRRLGGDEAYKKTHDALINLQGPPDNTALTQIAASLNLDMAKIAPIMQSAEVALILENNRQMAQQLQIQGTPTFVINDAIIRGYVPLDGLQAVVEEQRALSAASAPAKN